MSNKEKTQPFDLVAKIITIGDSGVGKTKLVTRYCDNCFKQSYVATIGVDFKLKILNLGSTNIKLQIWDTAGQERFKNVTQAYYKGARGVILTYDITSKNSFSNLTGWIRLLQSNTHENVIKVLIGTKKDLEQDRQVQYNQGEDMAKKYGMYFFQVSAKKQINVNQAFQTIAQKLIDGDNDNYDIKSIKISRKDIVSEKQCFC